jgi:hypothetical protein
MLQHCDELGNGKGISEARFSTKALRFVLGDSGAKRKQDYGLAAFGTFAVRCASIVAIPKSNGLPGFNYGNVPLNSHQRRFSTALILEVSRCDHLDFGD